jgi:ubiquitin carboxyl-terminal hydrolase 14
MAEVQVKVKHQGKVYDVSVNTESNGEELKMQLYSLTNVEPEHQKIIAKKMVKDDTPLSSLGLKNGAIVTLIGSPSADAMVEAPREKMKFTEDMTEAELAQQEGAIPAGLQNTGNTCYANATLQTLRAIPELQQELQRYTIAPQSSAASSSNLFSAEQLAQHGIGGLGGGSDLTGALRDLYKQLSETQQGIPPIMFLTALRQQFPQFAERSKTGHGYAQQDAEEVWSQLIHVLQGSLKISEEQDGFKNWVDKYMGGKYEITTKSAEAPEEEPVVNIEDFHDLKCNITDKTNHLREGLETALTEQIEKNSPTQGKDIVYDRVSKISRLPKYLPIHLIRFFWRKDSKKKAKILRKVTFQHEIDLLEFCTDELKQKLIPVRDKIRDVRKEEEDVERAKKRQKRMRKDAEEAASGESNVRSDEPLQKKKEKEDQKTKTNGAAADGQAGAEKTTAAGSKDVEMGGTEEFKTDEEIERERAESILAAKKELLSLVHEDMKKDPTAGQTGLYELRGVVTHQGSSADSGHYTAYVKKAAPPGKVEDGKW